MGLFLIFGAAILLRILAVQLNGDHWAQREVDQQVFFKKQVADRGNILAEDGTILATSLPFYKIALDPTVIDTAAWLNFPDSLMILAANLATHFGGEEKDTLAYYNRVMEAMRKKDRHLYLTRQKINFQELKMVRTWPIVRWGRYEGGFIIEKFNNERFYPMGDLARITLGRIIQDTVPIRGIEYAYNHDLRGADGYILAQKVAGKSYVPLDQYGEEVAVDGRDIVTTLDVDMQDVVEKALARGVERHVAKFGTAILMEVETGKIKAIANYPETFNYAVATQIEPGSTFKTVSATAMMEDGLIEICDTIDTGNGTILYDDKEVTDDGKAWGKIDFERVFAYSSNVGVSKAVNDRYKENPERYMEHLERFGLTHTVNTQLQGEPVPQLIRPGDTDWNVATLPSLSYGYSIQVTPLQMATFYNGLANNGKLIRPWVVRAIQDNGRSIMTYEPEILHPRMCSPETAIKVRELLKAVAEYGTAKRAFKDLPFAVAGKTGTARKTKRGVGYIRKYRASFGGYFPADKPRFTLYVMVDEPDGGYASGGRVAAPIFREIAEEIYRMDMQLAQPPHNKTEKPAVQPAPKAVFAQSAREIYEELGIQTSNGPTAKWLQTASNGHQVNLDSLAYTDGIIPNLKGMTGRDALYLLQELGCKVVLRGTGRVRRQSLLPGYRFKEGAAITLFLS